MEIRITLRRTPCCGKKARVRPAALFVDRRAMTWMLKDKVREIFGLKWNDIELEDADGFVLRDFKSLIDQSVEPGYGIFMIRMHNIDDADLQ